MGKTRDLNEFINELNERVWAIEMMQQLIIAVLSGQSEEYRGLLREGVEGYINDLPESFRRTKLQSMLNRYRDLVNGPKSEITKPHLRLYKFDKDNDENE